MKHILEQKKRIIKASYHENKTSTYNYTLQSRIFKDLQRMAYHHEKKFIRCNVLYISIHTQWRQINYSFLPERRLYSILGSLIITFMLFPLELHYKYIKVYGHAHAHIYIYQCWLLIMVLGQ